MSLKQMIRNEITNKINREYPHLKMPTAMYARITGAAQQGTDYIYNIKILGKDLGYSSEHPEIPGVKSKLKIETGKSVVVLLMYGELNPFIVGEAIL